MAAPLKIVVPVPMTGSMLVDTDVLEADYPAIAGSTAYVAESNGADGSRVMSAHKVYECVADFTTPSTPVPPENDPTHWLKVSPTNRWRLFDNANFGRTAKATSFYYRITPGQAINAVYPVGLVDCNSVRVQMIDPTYGTVYDRTIDTSARPVAPDWYAFLLGNWTASARFAAFDDLPTFPGADLRVDFTGTTKLACGKLVFGQQTEWGMGVQAGTQIGIKDYSVNDKSKWGDPILQQGLVVPTNGLQFPMANDQIDAFFDYIAAITSTPTLYVGGARAVTVRLATVQDVRILINYSTWSDVELSLLSLT